MVETQTIREQQPFIHPAAEYRTQPEVLANPPLPNTELIVSVPLYHKEWSRGAFLKNLQSLLSQKVNSGKAIEINYVLNTGALSPWVCEYDFDENREKITPNSNEAAQAAFQDIQACRQLIEDIMAIQRLSASHAEPSQIEELLGRYPDITTQGILRQAAEQASTIQLSAVDISRLDYRKLNLTQGIESFRTVGLDYAIARLRDNEDAVFMTYDCDTAPASNKTLSDLLALYDANADADYFFSRLSYSVPSANKAVVETAPSFITSKVAGYNLDRMVGSPQISMRLRTAKQINEISKVHATGFSYHEDFDTAFRLVGLVGDMSTGLLLKNHAEAIPMFLTEDRIQGFSDGERREEMAEQLAGLSFEEQLEKERASLLTKQTVIREELDSIDDPQIKAHLEAELQLARDSLKKQMVTNRRLNRLVARDLLSAPQLLSELQRGNLTDAIKEQIIRLPRGKLALRFVEQNLTLLQEMTDTDMAAINYLISEPGSVSFSPDSLTDFQKTLREYIGSTTGTPDQAPVLEDTFVEAMAYGHVHTLYTQRKMALYGHEGTNPESDYADSLARVRTNYEGFLSRRTKDWTEVIPTRQGPVSGEKVSLRAMLSGYLEGLKPGLGKILKLFR